LASFFQSVDGDAGMEAAGLFKSPAALQYTMIVQEFDRQSPPVNMSGRPETKTKH
jgi:hypothetical protein